MLVSKSFIAITALALSIAPLGLGAGVAAADEVEVVVPSPFFYPRTEFQYDGYYRSNNGHYYHYDSDRDGWHWGRNHREGVRYEERHHHWGHR